MQLKLSLSKVYFLNWIVFHQDYNSKMDYWLIPSD